MEYEMMIHGKPNAGSFNATSGIKTFANQLDQEFFSSKDKFQGKNFFIVDARYWNGIWYSIYTYWVSNNIKGIDGRGSYIAISVIVPKRYYLLVSEVYKKILSLYKNNVVGKYISTNGDYLVQDLSRCDYFNELCAAFGKSFTNLEEDFDNKFNSRPHENIAICYHPKDCDSLAFVDDLRLHGRIFISEQFETKDAKLDLVNKYKMELTNYQDKTKKQENEIRQLKEEKASLENALKNNQKVGKDKLSELSNKNVALQKKLDSCTERLNRVQDIFFVLQDQVKEASGLFNRKQQNYGHITSEKENIKSTKSVWHFFSLSLLNTILILAFGILLLLCVNGKIGRNEDKKVVTDTIASYEVPIKHQEAGLEDIEDKSDETIGNGLSDLSTSTNVSSNDEECSLMFVETDGSPSSGSLTTPKVLKYKKQDGYDFYFDNISNENDIRKAIATGTKFLVIKKDPKKKASIIYRSSDASKLNNNNKITF